MRKPLTKWHPYEGAGGPHSGVQVVNVHPQIAKACFDGDRVNEELYLKLHTTIDLDGLYDILELKDTLSSWKAAEAKNADWRRNT